MSKLRNYNCIDFETANEQRTSVCSVGVVIVRNDVIVDSFYSLIHPEPEYYQWFCQQVHGLGPEDTEDAPVFPKVWAKIEPLLEGYPMVAHNSLFDEGCLKAVFTGWTIPIISSTIPWRPPGFTSGRPSLTTNSRRSHLPAGSILHATIMRWPMQRPARG